MLELVYMEKACVSGASIPDELHGIFFATMHDTVRQDKNPHDYCLEQQSAFHTLCISLSGVSRKKDRLYLGVAQKAKIET